MHAAIGAEVAVHIAVQEQHPGKNGEDEQKEEDPRTRPALTSPHGGDDLLGRGGGVPLRRRRHHPGPTGVSVESKVSEGAPETTGGVAPDRPGELVADSSTDGLVSPEPVVGDSVGELPDSTGLVLGDPDGPGPLVETDGVVPGPPVVGVPDGPPTGDEALPESDGVGTGRPGTSVGETETPDDDGVSGGSCRVVSGTLDGTPGRGSTELGAKGVAPMKLRTSTTVYAAHGTPSP
ncbi:hypothetical protein [Streptomyces phaeochromogenes]